MGAQALHPQRLEQAPPNGRRVDMHLETQLRSRLCNVFAVPGQNDENIRLLLEQLAAKLHEEPPA
jgi:hypothetical protein